MLKSVEKCLHSKKDLKVGNHGTWWSLPSTGEQIQYFTYHGNVICRVNWTKHTVYLTNAGWNTSSTNRALNDYKRYFQEGWSITWDITDTREK